jgi:uncharacterized membrane protein YfbV (UPF0208 family)
MDLPGSIIAQDGVAGTNGVDGVNGIDGVNGVDGVSIVWLGNQAIAPATPNLNEAYYNTTSGQSFIWDGSAWQIIAQDGVAGTNGVDGVNGIDGINGVDGVSIVWLGNQAIAPATPNLNEAYYNTTSGQSFIWDGSAWQIIAQDGVAGTNGTDGVNGTNGIDGINGTNGLDGVSIVWLGSQATAPGSPTLNQAYYNTTTGQSFIWDGSAWNIFLKMVPLVLLEL